MPAAYTRLKKAYYEQANIVCLLGRWRTEGRENWLLQVVAVCGCCAVALCPKIAVWERKALMLCIETASSYFVSTC